MGKYLNIGNAGFASIIKSEYVDKTGIIEYINRTLGTPKKLTCFSRPRRFGKSYAAKMLCAYYDKSCDSRDLFKNYKISESPDFNRYLNKYDVIYLDITWFISIAGNKENIDNVVKNIQNSVIEELVTAYPDIKPGKTLPETLYAVSEKTGNKFIIIIDEWDALFREAKENRSIQEEYIQLLRGLFKSSGQTDQMIEAAYMTGILPIKKYGTQSAMTDFREYTMLSPQPLGEYVGFTEREVQELCKDSKLSFNELKKWYDGYELEDDTHIYSPKSVMDALEKGRIGNYWTQSETYESLRIYIDMDQDGLQGAISQLLRGEYIPLDVDTFQNDMVSIKSKDDVLTLLVHLGYLAYHYEEGCVSIPNEEVKKEFMRAIRRSDKSTLIELLRNSQRILDATIAMDAETVADAISLIHSSQTAPTFYNNEQALRSVIRLAYLTCIDEYSDIQELPSGKGYADIVFIPKKRSDKPAMIIELKWNKDAATAIQQIKSNNYPQVLQTFEDEILLVGINYDIKSKKHTCIIERYQLDC